MTKNTFRKYFVLLCLFAVLLTRIPSANAATVQNWTNENLLLSYERYGGTYADGMFTTDGSASWSYSEGKITGTVVPGTKFYTIVVSTWYFPESAASTVLTLTNNMENDGLLTFNYTESDNQGKVQVDGADEIKNGTVKAILAPDESVTVTVTTKKDPPSAKNADNRTTFTASTTISGISLTEIVTHVDVELAAVSEGGSYTATAEGNPIAVGQTHENMAVETEYSFTATPQDNYQFDGWYFNGEKQPNTSYTISDITFGKDTLVEARFVLDPVYAITTATGAYTKDQLVIVDSRYLHSSDTSFLKEARADNVYCCYHSVASNEDPNIKFYSQLEPWLQWSQSDSKVTISSSGTATGEQETNGARSWAYANRLSDVIQVYALKDCIIEFSYTNNCYGGKDESAEDENGNTVVTYGNLPLLHVYKSTSGEEVFEDIVAKGTVYEDSLARTETQAETSGRLTYALNEGEYLYIYTNGLTRGATTILLGSGSHQMQYSYNASLYDISVQYNDVSYTQTTKFQDNLGNGLSGGVLYINNVAYNIDAAGNPLDANGNPASITYRRGERLSMYVAAPANYRLLGWNVNGTMVYTPTYEYQMMENTAIHPVFVPDHVTYDTSKGTYTYLHTDGSTVPVGERYIARNHDCTAFYSTLEAAFAEQSEVVLLASMTIEGNYTIESGDTLVVPCSMTTVFEKQNGVYLPLTDMYSNSTYTYAMLTVSGNINVDGALLLSGYQFAGTGGHSNAQGSMTLLGNSTVTVGMKGAFYSYGYVEGTGTILAKGDGTNGAQIHECCDIIAVPHPMVMQKLVENEHIMPLNTYYPNSIRAKTQYEPGAALEGHFSLQYDATTKASIGIIAPSNCCFTVKSGTVTKQFDSTLGQIVINVDPDAKVETNSFNISISATLGTTYTLSMDSNNVDLPLSNGWRIVVDDGAYLTVKNRFKMLPGAVMDVKKGGTVEIVDNGRFVFYRLNDYDYRSNWAVDGEHLGFNVVGYPINIPGYGNFNLDNVGSAKLNVDGHLIANGKLYVTNTEIGVREETDEKLIYKNYAHRKNGYNFLTGTGVIDMGSGSNSTIKEYVVHHTDHDATLATIQIVPMKGLLYGQTVDAAANYTSLSGTYYGVETTGTDVYGNEGQTIYVWTNDPCKAGRHADSDSNLVCDKCSTKLAKLVSINAAADSTTELVLKFQFHGDLLNRDKTGFADGVSANVSFELPSGDTRETKTRFEDGLFVVTQPVASGEMTKPVVVTAQNGGAAVPIIHGTECADSLRYTVADYVKAVIASDATTDAQKEFVKALLTYGSYAQDYFTGRDGYSDLNGLADAGDMLDSLTALASLPASYTVTTSGASGSIQYSGQQAYLGSAIKLRVYFNETAGYTFKVTVRGRSYTAIANSDGNFIEIRNIPAAYLNEVYTITAINGSDSYVVNTSVMAYLNSAVGNDSKLIPLANAIWTYNQAAREFFEIS